MAWLLFSVFLAGLVLADLGLGRQRQTLTVREAALRTVTYVILAAFFGAYLWTARGSDRALEYFAGYLVEYSLSIDNIFVFIALFSQFAVPAPYQPRVLMWGVLGALVLRLVMILAGAALLERFHWTLYVFGAFLVLTGFRFLKKERETVDPARNPFLRLLRKLLPVTERYEGPRFVVRRSGRLWATPLLVVLVLIETADLFFALDSIPAIFGITRDPFIVYTANAFAVLGLRSLFFFFSALLPLVRYLHYGLAATLVFIGVKMLLAEFVHIPVGVSLLVLASLLGTAALASFLLPGTTCRGAPQREEEAPADPLRGEQV